MRRRGPRQDAGAFLGALARQFGTAERGTSPLAVGSVEVGGGHAEACRRNNQGDKHEASITRRTNGDLSCWNRRSCPSAIEFHHWHRRYIGGWRDLQFIGRNRRYLSGRLGDRLRLDAWYRRHLSRQWHQQFVGWYRRLGGRQRLGLSLHTGHRRYLCRKRHEQLLSRDRRFSGRQRQIRVWFGVDARDGRQLGGPRHHGIVGRNGRFCVRNDRSRQRRQTRGKERPAWQG